jgi:arylsulfatase A-like enzyme
MHYDIYDEQTHTPLIIKTPKLKPAQITSLASGVDVLPTLLSILNIPAPETEGYDLLPHISGRANSPREAVYITRTAMWERIMSDYEGLAEFLALDDKEHFADVAIRTLNWKLIHRRAHKTMEKWGWHNYLTGAQKPIPEYELYNLDLDPKEKNNIYERERQNPEVVYVQNKLEQWEQVQFKQKLPPQNTLEIQPYF